MLARALALCLLACVPSIAEAQEGSRVAVEAIRGPRGGTLRAALVESLETGGVIVVDAAEVAAAKEEAGVRGAMSESQVVEIATALSLTAVIDGRVQRRRRRWSLSVRVRNGEDGTTIGSSTWGGRTAAALGAVRRSGHGRLEDYLAAATSPNPAPRQPRGVTPEAGDQPWYGQVEEETPSVDQEEDEDEEEDDDDGEGGDERWDWLSIRAVGGTLRRSTELSAVVSNCVLDGMGREVCSRSPGGGTEIDETRRYVSRGIGHMELGAEAEFYPGAIGDEQAVPWFGFVLGFRHSLFLSSVGCRARTPATAPCTSNDEIELPTSQYDLYFGARARYRFGEERRSPAVTADLGYSLFSFGIDTQALEQLELPSVIAPVDYSSLHIGAGLSYGLVPVYLTVGVRAGYRFGLGVGDDARRVWGVLTTDASAFQIGVDVRSEAPYITEGAYFGLLFEFFQYSVTYRGQTAAPWEEWPYTPNPADPRDNTAVSGGIEQPVSDTYIRLGLALGYSVR